jgi:hypothetical protein
MKRPYKQFVSEDKGRAKKAFNEHYSDLVGKLHGNPQDYDRVKRIQAHSEGAREILNENFKEERQDRVARMATEIWDERNRKYTHFPEHLRIRLMSEQSILNDARQRVDHQHDKDLAAIDQSEVEAIEKIVNGAEHSKQTISQKEIANMSAQEKDTHIVQEMHKLAKDAREARFQVSKLVASTREQMLEEARTNGAADPAAQVKSVIASMYKGVEDNFHSGIQRTFEKYGYDKEHQQVRFFANNQDLDTLELNELRESERALSVDERAEASIHHTQTVGSEDDQSQ